MIIVVGVDLYCTLQLVFSLMRKTLGMKIKRLELTGFKSFRDKTVIDFDSNITGIVGPNGCGKSNIVDAFCWVMGETSAKTLRGAGMDDMIFKGANGFAPSGMAEVSLIFDADGSTFPIQYKDFSQLQLTRRLHRGGQSEYLVNNKPVRLRDIQEIFMDISAGGLSVIEQGAIGNLVVAKPEQRRALIEEAAGISKFRVRKKEAIRKLETTDNNLTRIGDIINESKRQLDFLDRQAKRAKRYKDLKVSYRNLDLIIASDKYRKFVSKLESVENAIFNYQSEITVIDSSISTANNIIAAKKLKIVELERTINNAKKNIGSDNIKTKEDEINKLTWEIEEAGRVICLNNERKTEFLNKKENLQSDLANLKDFFSKYSLKLDSLNNEYSKLNSQYNEIKNILSGAKSRVDLSKENVTFLESQKSKTSLDLTESKVRSEELNKRIEDILSSKTNLKKRHEGLKLQVKDLDEKIVFYKSELEKYNLTSLKFKKEQLATQIKQKHAELDEFKSNLNKVSGRLYSLETLSKNFEGFQAGIKSLMSKKAHAHPDGGYSMLPVAQVVKVDKKYELAMESSLGLKLQTMVTDSHTEAIEAIDYLKENNSGRSSFAGSYRTKKKVVPENIVGMLSSFVEVDDKYSDVINNILDGVAIVESIDDAIKLNKNYPENTFVTLDGDVLSDGILTAGTLESADSGILRRKREIEELGKLKTEWHGKLYLAKESLNKKEESLNKIYSEINSCKTKVSEYNIKLAEVCENLKRTKKELLSIENEIAKTEANSNKLESEKTNLNTKLDTLTNNLDKLNVEYEKHNDNYKELLNNISSDQVKEHDVFAKMMELKAVIASKSQELKAKTDNVQTIEKNILEVSNNINELDKKSEKDILFIEKSNKTLETKKEELTLLIDRLEQCSKEQSDVINAYDTLKNEISEHTEEIAQFSNQLLEKNQKLNDVELEKSQINLKIENLSDQVYEKHMLDLSKDYIKEDDDNTDIEQLSKKLVILSDKLQKFSDVNLTAIDEYEETLKRYNFLVEQRDDLLSSKDELKKVIDKIGRVCTKRFKEKFEAVNERFKQVFPILFGGGEASIELVEPMAEDGKKKATHEMGIDINVSPPGRKLQNVNLLSGGEKALTATALIFSVFLVKSSPFCLLDEVDAPLDDANVVRFNKLIQEMSHMSQIILVTHNKQTMEFSDRLYGVTMEDKGISKMVSVSQN